MKTRFCELTRKIPAAQELGAGVTGTEQAAKTPLAAAVRG